jgi:hypothetical protein
MDFKYKGFTVSVEKGEYFTWYAFDSNGNELSDSEGGDLGSMGNAKDTIKRWIDQFLQNPEKFAASDMHGQILVKRIKYERVR